MRYDFSFVDEVNDYTYINQKVLNTAWWRVTR
jgi:hypothetical protein